MRRNLIGASLLAFVFLSGCSFKKVSDFILEPARQPDPEVLSQVKSTIEARLLWTINYQPLNGADVEGLHVSEDAQRLYVGMPNGMVTAFYQTNQPTWADQVDWQVLLDSPILAGPVLFNNTLYVGTADGQLVALTSDTGQVKWMRQLSSSIDAALVVADNRLLARTLDSHVYALDLATGEIIWQVQYEAPALALQGEPAVTVEEDKVFVAWENGLVEALSLETGVRLWQQRLATPKGRTDLERMVDIQARPYLFDGRLYVVAFHGKLAALDSDSGALVWVKDFSSYRDLAVWQDRLIVVDDTDVLYAYDLITGTRIWQQEELKYRQLTDLTLWNDRIITADEKGLIHFVSPVNGQFTARIKHHSQPVVKTIVLGNRIIVIDGEGYLSLYQLSAHHE
jgi:outer membrane protein assembly factor BamB